MIVVSLPFPSEYSAEFDYSSFGAGIFFGLVFVFGAIGSGLGIVEDREIRAKNQLRVNGFSFGLYFGVWTTINAAQMVFLWGAIMGLVQIYQGRNSAARCM